ncbi:MAG: hypothetical protein KatS3mg111_2056 [Pirellulaceae bacterium]|nr:MAG: hypothetical protein KatS3mg111_2056 [Pirellulaceae bacterium]
MHHGSNGMPLLVAVIWGCLMAGCNNKQETQTASVERTADSSAQAASGDSHHHAHDDLGPHGGHWIHLQPTGAHAEWTHDDETHTISVYLEPSLDDSVEAVQFEVKIGEQTEQFPLQRKGEAWTIVSEPLLTHLNMGEAVDTTLQVVSGDQQLSARIEAHEEHHHHH